MVGERLEHNDVPRVDTEGLSLMEKVRLSIEEMGSGMGAVPKDENIHLANARDKYRRTSDEAPERTAEQPQIDAVLEV